MSKTPVFPVLQDLATEDGRPWHLLQEGDAVATRNKAAVVMAKDASGNGRMPSVDSQDRLIVNTEADDVVELDGVGDNAGSGSQVTLFDITLQNSMDYKNVEWMVSCFREATFEFVHIDDLGGTPTELILGTPKVGAGSFTSSGKKTARFTTGATGVQVLRVRAQNLNATSQLEACLSVQEVQ